MKSEKTPDVAPKIINFTFALLGQLCEIKTNFSDADFWLIRSHDKQTVGKPIKEYKPGAIGIKVLRTDLLFDKFLFYYMLNMWQKGYWQMHCNGSLKLQHIKVSHVNNLLITLKAE